MFGYLILINLLLPVSSPQIKREEENTVQDEENTLKKEEKTARKEKIQVRAGIPVVISYHKKTYHLPYKASITTSSQRQEFYYHEEKDGRFYCPLKDIEEKKGRNNADKNRIEDIKYRYCLVETTFAKKEAKRCKGEVEPIIVEKTNAEGSLELCGSDTRLKYKFAYQVCIRKSALTNFLRFWKKSTMRDMLADLQHPHTYEICYDHSENRVIYTEHKIMSPYILRNLRLEKEVALHDFSQTYSTVTYGIENLNNLQKIFQAYNSQPYFDGYRREYELQMLSPIIDFALGHWKKTTLHLINYGPQHIQRLALWEAIYTQVNNKIVYDKKNPDIKIFTGTWGIVLNDKGEEIYLGNDKELAVTIPKYWWKVLYDLNEYKATAVIMHNQDISKRICEPNKEACDLLKWRPDLGKWFYKNVYCCDLQSASDTIKSIDNLGITSADDTRVLEILDLN